MPRRVLPSLSLVLLLVPALLGAQTAPDATPAGPFPITSAEYKLPAGVDPVVLADAPAPFRLQTELWARVYRPAMTGNWPLLVFLHGNHATCGRDTGFWRFDTNVQYTFTGTCPSGYVVVPSHDGYAYLAEKLASWGYLVVSINANRGVNAAPGFRTTPAGTPLAPTDDPGLNQRRGRLVLRHLEQLYRWNAGVDTTPASLGTTLAGQIDFNEVGFMGHSRGGEGVRAAYNFYTNPATPGAWIDWSTVIPVLDVHGVFEIGPVDGQTGTLFDSLGTAWNVLLPMCDGDVFNLQGVRPFDRMLLAISESTPAPKSTFTVWGANHNFYNSEWQLSDSPGCFAHEKLFGNLLGSPEQRTTGLASVLAFFRGTVGEEDPSFLQNFNPLFGLPAVVTDVTRVDRGYTDSPDSSVTQVFDNFQPGSPNVRTAAGATFTIGGIADHSVRQRVAQVEWDDAGPGVYFQSASAANVDATGFATLDFRVSRQCGDPLCTSPDNFFNFESNFSIRLVDGSGAISIARPLENYISLTGPVGGLVAFAGASPHPTLQTVRIPLSAFTGVDLGELRAVRFVFDDTESDEIFIGNIQLSKIGIVPGGAAPASIAMTPPGPAGGQGDSTQSDGNRVWSVRSVRTATGQAAVEIELTSPREFLPQGEILVLNIGGRHFTTSRYPATGETSTIIFTLSTQEFGELAPGDPIRVQYGSDARGGWSFGRLGK